MTVDTCEDCGAANPRTALEWALLSDRCTDRHIAAITRHSELPATPPPLEIVSIDGCRHVLMFRIWRVPTGIEVELEEAGVPIGEGYHFAVLGSHDANIDELVTGVKSQAKTEVSRRYLEPNPHRSGWIVRDNEVAGRLIYNEDSGTAEPYDAEIDGRTLTWGGNSERPLSHMRAGASEL